MENVSTFAGDTITSKNGIKHGTSLLLMTTQEIVNDYSGFRGVRRSVAPGSNNWDS